MSQTIWKYELELQAGEQPVTMPVGSTILDVQMQRGAICIWAMVNSNSDRERRRFIIFGTGNVLPEQLLKPAIKHIGTVQDGGYVWHIFELDPPA